jgi:flagellar biosynthesis protein FlhA
VRDDPACGRAHQDLISGVKVAQGELRVGRLLAIDPSGTALKALPGETVREPSFGLSAKWIAAADRSRAEAAGTTVVDPSAVVATHLTEIVRRHASELLGRREAQELLDLAAKSNSKVVEELIPHLLPLGDVIKVLKALLTEGVSVRDIRTILEALADHAPKEKDPPVHRARAHPVGAADQHSAHRRQRRAARHGPRSAGRGALPCWTAGRRPPGLVARCPRHRRRRQARRRAR